jgi:hypothetical protein
MAMLIQPRDFAQLSGAIRATVSHMRLAVALLCLAATLFAQQSNVPTKSDPKGYSKDVLDDAKASPSDLGEHKVYKPGDPQPKDAGVAELPADLQNIVTVQFGKDCKVAMQRSSIVVNYRIKTDDKWNPFFTADLDHDGVEDAIIVARCENPVARKDEFGYVMTDPYMAFHGYGDPKITQEFASGDPMQGHIVLIIHGAGAEAWRAEKPKAKFLVLNLPFTQLGMTNVVARKGKPPVRALLLQEGETMSSVLYWDGKKYRWRDSTQMN